MALHKQTCLVLFSPGHCHVKLLFSILLSFLLDLKGLGWFLLKLLFDTSIFLQLEVSLLLLKGQATPPAIQIPLLLASHDVIAFVHELDTFVYRGKFALACSSRHTAKIGFWSFYTWWPQVWLLSKLVNVLSERTILGNRTSLADGVHQRWARGRVAHRNRSSQNLIGTTVWCLNLHLANRCLPRASGVLGDNFSKQTAFVDTGIGHSNYVLVSGDFSQRLLHHFISFIIIEGRCVSPMAAEGRINFLWSFVIIGWRNTVPVLEQTWGSGLIVLL